ncbi:glycoside hydrolase family 43 protein [Agromyces ramosus]|uniref:Arabinan endo-1,5-alpha-L-arabinosidase n=1 Tax=Agromyces ramosus TaxID=33879 RepID=A0ABU0R5R3_9MICO|nr:glycoside hydrolase family 43 protein [Agromyces ramosus]MDQ0893428.1 arabinan endo-1,5-alpha-L-arabinosidase [Agromyces ramosus]
MPQGVRRAVGVVVAGVLALAAAGCAAGPSGPDASGSAAPSASGGSEAGPAPVIDRDFPDPDVLETGGRYYLYATNDSRRNVQVAVTDDLSEWEVLDDDALPVLPDWVIPGKTWAPEVTEVSPGRFVMYTTTTNFDPALQCIAVATSDSPTGPFEIVGEAMLICPEDEGGAIDASTFRDESGGLHLLWKNDGNCCGLDTWLQMAPLTSDGVALAGPSQPLVMQTLEWEGDLVEAPTLVQRDGVYHLFYSASFYGDESYAVGHATAPALAGPWTKDEEPFFSTASTDGALLGPGGQDIVTDAAGDDVFVFHAWDPLFLARKVFTLPLVWEGGVPRVVVER